MKFSFKNKKIKDNLKFLKKNLIVELIAIPQFTPIIPRQINIINNNSKKNIKSYLKKKFLTKDKLISNINKSKFDNIIVSHLVNLKNVNFNNDFYFGEFAKYLGREKTLIVLINHLDKNKYKTKFNVNENYIILADNLAFCEELKLHIKTFFIIFFKGLTSPSLNIFSLVNIVTSIENQRIALQIRNLVRKYSCKKIFFTFEGNPFEKLICYYINHISKKIKKIGYQFGIFREHQHSIFVNFGKKYMPNLILTTGEYNKKTLNKGLKKKLDIKVIGQLNKHTSNKKYIKTKKEFKNILIMPEGLKSEVLIFLNFCQKKEHENINFTLRLHPLLKNSNFLENFKLLKYKNIRISNNSLAADFKSNYYLLYRGTSAVLDALKNKLVPIYLKENINEISIDPLFENNKYHNICYEDNLNNLIDKTYHKKKITSERKKLFLIAQNFHSNINMNLIKSLKL